MGGRAAFLKGRRSLDRPLGERGIKKKGKSDSTGLLKKGGWEKKKGAKPKKGVAWGNNEDKRKRIEKRTTR